MQKDIDNAIDKFKDALETLMNYKNLAYWIGDMLFNVNRMTRQAVFMQVYHDIHGGRLAFPRWFKVPKPEIELSQILEIVSKMKAKRNPSDYQYCVYLNILEDTKFYVGVTDAMYIPNDDLKNAQNAAYSRLADHRDGGGQITPTYWTYYYPTITNLCFFPGDKDDEDNMTLLVAKAIGTHRVRGGRWTKMEPWSDDAPLEVIIERLLNKI